MFHVALREKPATARVLVPEDSERSFVTMAFSTVNRWGVKGHARDTFEEFPGGEAAFDACMSRHGSMFVSRSLALAQDVLNNRLYEGIRERGGLVYSIGIEWEPYQYMDAGFFSITLAPMPEKQDVAIEKVTLIIQEFLRNGFTEEEMSASKVVPIPAISYPEVERCAQHAARGGS
jgi:predicted Zn-dependent peptidase